MNILGGIILPLLIVSIPLLLICLAYKYLKHNFWFTVATVIASVVIGAFTPFIAVFISANVIARSMMNVYHKSLTGSAFFLLLGSAFTFAAFILGIIACLVSYKIKDKI